MTPEQKEHAREYKRVYYLKNKATILAKNKAYYLRNWATVSQKNMEYVARNQEKTRQYKKAYRAEHLEKIQANNRAHYLQNRERYHENHRTYVKEHREEIRRQKQDYEAKRMREEPEFKLYRSLRNRIRFALNGASKSARTIELIGCTILEWRLHLERQFRPGMAWENHGPVWHIDHIRPCVSFDLTNPAQQRECFHWSNTQPLFVIENLKKGTN